MLLGALTLLSVLWFRQLLSSESLYKGFSNMPSILLIVLVILLIAALPTWRYSGGWGYYPAGGLGTIVVVILILLLLGRI